MADSLVAVDYTQIFVEASILQPTEILFGTLILALSLALDITSKLIHFHEARYLTPMNISHSASFQDISNSFQSNYVSINDSRFGWNKTLNLHFLNEGNSDNREVILCLHGVPFWSHSFHRIIPYFIKEGYNTVVPDLIGFGKSERYTDWKAYNLELHKSTIIQLLQHLQLNNGNKTVTLVGHNWGFLLGATLLKDNPTLFRRIVILNTNNLPDGEVDFKRFKSITQFCKYLIIDAFFLLFRASILLFGKYLPPKLLFYALGNGLYNEEDIHALTAPFQRIHKDRGGMVSFPLMVPVFADDRYAAEFHHTRNFFANHWNSSNTLIIFSEKTVLPWIFGAGDFIVGNRRSFFRHLIPKAHVAPPIENAGHIVMYDQPKRVGNLITDFLSKLRNQQ